jgi:hypothetical protein
MTALLAIATLLSFAIAGGALLRANRACAEVEQLREHVVTLMRDAGLEYEWLPPKRGE